MFLYAFVWDNISITEAIAAAAVAVDNINNENKTENKHTERKRIKTKNELSCPYIYDGGNNNNAKGGAESAINFNKTLSRYPRRCYCCCCLSDFHMLALH